MKKIIIYFILFCLLMDFGYASKAAAVQNIPETLEVSDYDITMKQDLLCMMMGYPQYVKGVERDNEGKIYLVLKSNRKILYDDKRQKNLEQKMANPDIQDVLEQIYPLNSISTVMQKDFDPGRVRLYPLFLEVYGASKQKVEANLKNVNLGSGVYQFNKNNNAASALQTAIKELTPAAKRNPAIWSHLSPCSGTFNYRVISGTGMLSPHAFAIAVDLARDKRDYWKWASVKEAEKRIQSYPKEMVEIFEQNNFVWGGKWSHFDILHFEYRPEIILKAKYFGGGNTGKKLWCEGIPAEDAAATNFIKIIDEALN